MSLFSVYPKAQNPFDALLKHPNVRVWITLIHPTPLGLELTSLLWQETLTIVIEGFVSVTNLEGHQFFLTFSESPLLIKHSFDNCELCLLGKTCINNK